MNGHLRSLSAVAALSLTFPAFSHADEATFVLKLKERVPLEQLAENAVRFGVTYTPEQIRDISGPSDESYRRLLDSLRARGLEITGESKTRLYVSVHGDRAKLANQLNARALLRDPDMLMVDGISRSDSGHRRHPHYRIASFHSQAALPKDQGVPPAVIKQAYDFDAIYSAGLTGKGQQIAIATYDDFRLEDVQNFYRQIGLSALPSVDKVRFNGTPLLNEDSAVETELDSEFSGMIAPGAHIHVFASAENSDAGELAMFTAIMDDNRAKVVNYSWGLCESQTDRSHRQAMTKVFAQAVAQGINIMVASGDSGAQGCQGDPTKQADWPGAHPYIVGVGGTTLVNSGGTFELGWNGSGGGVSGLYKRPAWQTEAGLQAPFVRRSFPDVAFNADYQNSGQAIWVTYQGQTGWLVIGGTSMAAPQWSGFLALVGESRASSGHPTLGFLNPKIYALPPAVKAVAFHDVTEGDNGQDGAQGYACTQGWDAVTGWGSMDAAELLKVLASD